MRERPGAHTKSPQRKNPVIDQVVDNIYNGGMRRLKPIPVFIQDFAQGVAKGKLYPVTRVEYARKAGITREAVRLRIRRGKLTEYEVVDTGLIFLSWSPNGLEWAPKYEVIKT